MCGSSYTERRFPVSLTLFIKFMIIWINFNANIQSQNLIFREINAGDVTEEMVSDLNDREYMKYSNNRFMRHTISSQLRYLEFCK